MGKFYKNSIEIEIKELANIIVDLRIKYGEIPAVIKLQDIYDEYAKGKKHYE